MIDREKVIKGLEVVRNAIVDGYIHEPDRAVNAITDALSMLKEQEAVVRCKDCKHGSLYCTEDVCGETLIECNRPDLGDVIEIHGWNWFCADGERKEE